MSIACSEIALPPSEPAEAAKQAGLRYVSDDEPGIRRLRAGRGFRYIAPDGSAIADPVERDRIRALVIPPAWEDVWICPRPNGHIQATGRDQKGRKQYRYHPRWHEVRDESKYGRMLAFARALPGIRERVAADMARRGLPREKVLATVVRLLETTLIRIGNEEYARTNDSFGLTTFRDQHVEVAGQELRFQFRAKSGKMQAVRLRDRRLARVVKACQDLPGQILFQYVDDDGERRYVDSADVNDYLRAIAGQDFTAKDFRTWAGTVLAAMALQEVETFDSEAAAKRQLNETIKRVAGRLGNTPAVCRKCYIHPQVLGTWLDPPAMQAMKEQTARTLRHELAGLSGEEAAVLAFLHARLERESANGGAGNGTARPGRRRKGVR